MKNLFKIGALSLAIAVSAAACGGGSTTTTTVKDSTKTTTVDTIKKVDTAKVVADTTKKK